MNYVSAQLQIVLPQFSVDFLVALFLHVGKSFQTEPTVLELSPPCVVVGDLHGQVLDLIRILAHYRDPVGFTYLFLGDLVDRGQFSLETVVLVYLLKAVFPTRVFVVRGNHEFSEVCSQHGFLNQILSVYNFQLFQYAVESFSYLPLAAQIGDNVLCVHGGLGPQLKDLAAIRAIVRPVDHFGDEKVDAIVWSDPSERTPQFEQSHTRGMGFQFGEAATEDFLRESNLKVLIRAHECVSDGYKWDFDRKILTVFSASNYCGSSHNIAGVAEITGKDRIEIQQFAPLPWVTRADVEVRMIRQTERPAKSIRAGMVAASHSLPKLKDEKKKGTDIVIRRRSSPEEGESRHG
jgi:protein phosphatase